MTQDKFESLHIQTYVDGKQAVGMYSRTSQDGSWDTHLMTGFIELENAASRRRVPFAPHALGGVVIVSPHASLWVVVRCWARARRAALANTGRIGWSMWLGRET